MANNYGNISELNEECQKLAINTQSRLDEKKAELGWLGVVFGSNKNSGYNIACVTITLCATVGLFCVIRQVLNDKDNPFIIWDHLSSVITLSLGYLFGVKTAK